MTQLATKIFSAALAALFLAHCVHGAPYVDDGLRLACPRTAHVFCYAHHYDDFTGHEIDCSKPVMCGDQKLFDRDIAPDDTICEADPAAPGGAKRVCRAGQCVRFVLDEGDC